MLNILSSTGCIPTGMMLTELESSADNGTPVPIHTIISQHRIFSTSWATLCCTSLRGPVIWWLLGYMQWWKPRPWTRLWISVEDCKEREKKGREETEREYKHMIDKGRKKEMKEKGGGKWKHNQLDNISFHMPFNPTVYRPQSHIWRHAGFLGIFSLSEKTA